MEFSTKEKYPTLLCEFMQKNFEARFFDNELLERWYIGKLNFSKKEVSLSFNLMTTIFLKIRACVFATC